MRRATIAVACVAALTVLTACPSKKDDGDKATGKTSTTTTAGVPVVRLTLDGVEPNGTKSPDEATVAKVMATLDAYLARAVVNPLFTGDPAGDLTDLFTSDALPRLDDAATRATLVEDGAPPASRSITASAAKVTLSSIAGPDEVVALIAARIDVKLHAVGPRIDVDIERAGELVLAPLPDGNWAIDSFGVRTARDTRDGNAGGS